MKKKENLREKSATKFWFLSTFLWAKCGQGLDEFPFFKTDSLNLVRLCNVQSYTSKVEKERVETIQRW